MNERTYNPADRSRLAFDSPVSPYMFERPGAPSELLRKEEARLIAMLADKAHMAGRKFIGWPKIELRLAGQGLYMEPTYSTLRVSVDTVPL